MIDPWRFARCFLLAILAVFWDGFGSSAPTAAVVVGTLPSFTVATSLAPKYGYDVMERSASTLNLTHRGVELLIASDPGVAGVRRDDAPGRVTTSQELMATKPGTVFRGDGRAAAEIFEDGMTARNPAMSIEEHLAGGNGLIGTSKSKFVANGFAVQNKGLIYVIDDVGGSAVKYPKNFNFLKGEQELFFTRIEPTQIRGAYTLKGEWIPNPNYRGG